MSALTIQGFVSIQQLIDNCATGCVATVGELSDDSRTYSKIKGEYSLSHTPGYTLTTFKVMDLGTGVLKQLEEPQVREILEVTRIIVSYAQSRIRPYKLEDFRATVQLEAGAGISDLSLGPLVDGQDIDLPGFATWKSLSNNNNEIRIWLADSAFSTQYPGYEVNIIPPLKDTKDFFRPYSEAKKLMEQRTITELTNLMQEARDVHPTTYTSILEFRFYNLYDPTAWTWTRWGVLTYGEEGNNIDAHKDAIADLLTADKTHTREQWEKILPEIFKRTEMVVVPRWDKIAIQNLTERSSLYDAALNPSETIAKAKDIIPSFGNWVDKHSYYVPTTFKTLGVLIINGTNNEKGKEDWKALFPDYLPIPSEGSKDFARMSINTQQWVVFINRLLNEAEKVTVLSALPKGVRREYRDGRLCVSQNFDGVKYLIVAKSNQAYQSGGSQV